MTTKKVYIAYTGGTIGMRWSDDGWTPAPGFLEAQMRQNPIFQDATMPHYDIEEFDPLLDSADMSPQDWVGLAQRIQAHIHDYDGFIILHGTDTMAYTASALAFMLEGLPKPVILTGSQLPLMEPRNDAIRNLTSAMLIAGYENIPEVALFFNQNLLRGCRTVKANSDSFSAFESPNYAPLATSGIAIKTNDTQVRRPQSRQARLTTHLTMDPGVGVLWLFPGITGDIMRNMLRPPLKGCVLKAFGVGNGPTANPEFMTVIREAIAQGVVIVDCTQCWSGTVSIGSYVTGSGLAAAGVVSGHDMTTEAAVTKLMYLFGKGHSSEQVRVLIGQDLRGELTPLIY